MHAKTHARAKQIYDHKTKNCKLHFTKIKKNTLLFEKICSIQKKIVSLHNELKIIQMCI